MGSDRDDGRLIGELLRRPYQAVVAHVAQALVVAGYDDLRPAHLSVFQHIDHPPAGTRPSVLAERAQVTKQSMGAVLTDLEARGYVARLADPHDQRAHLVRLTPRGWAAHDAAGGIVRELEATWAARLGEEQFTELGRLLRALASVVDP